MAAISTSRRALAGIILLIAGVLVALAALLPLAGITLTFLWALAYAALAVALIVLAVGAVNSIAAKLSLIVGAVGWALLAILSLGLSIPIPNLGTIAAFLAAIGTLVAAVVLLVGREIMNTPALVFVIAAILGALVLLGSFIGLVGGPFGTVLVIAFAAALIAAGFLFRQRERRR